ncbi:MAG: hypothetical protein KBF93_04190 [Leptospiraceae bacterium]|nr:hypothetical protein [Leptospiraceae bacterium]
MAPLESSNSNLTLSYDASDILGTIDKSLFLHKRPLLNADTMVKKGHFKSALEIYYRAVSKISNPEIQKKIQKNIADIHAYLKESNPESEKAFLEKYSDSREKEFTESLKEFTENLSDSLTEKLNILKQIETIPEQTDDKSQTTHPTSKSDDSELKPLDLGSLDAKKKEEVEEEPEEIEGNLIFEDDSEDSKPKKKKPKKANIKAKKEQISDENSTIETQSAQINADGAEIHTETNIQNANLDSVQVENQNLTQSSIENQKQPNKANIKKSPSNEEDFLSPEIKSSDIETGWSELETEPPKPRADKDYSPQMKKYEAGNIEIPESTEFITAEFKPKGSGNTESSPRDIAQGNNENIQPGIGMLQGIPNTSPNSGNFQNSGSEQQAFNVPNLPPPLPLNINDWLSNLYFSKEWEKFKPLPMKERRSGKDRRITSLDQLPKGIKKNRRSGNDRRKQNVDLLSERETFLKDWHKENQSIPPSLSKMLGTYPPSNSNFNQEDIQQDPNLASLEFLPRDPSSSEKLPSTEELVKVDLPNPEEITLKQPLDQNEISKEHVSKDIADSLEKYVPANEELGLPESDKGLVKIDLPDPVTVKAEDSELPHREVSGEIEVSSKDGTDIVGEAANKEKAKDSSGLGPVPYTPEAYSIPDELKIELPNPDDFVRTKSGHLIDPFAPEETPEINMIEGDGPQTSEEGGPEISEIPELPPPPPEPERTIHGILELKPPEIDDAPFLTLTYDFSKIPHPFKLSKNYSIMEYSYYKYKPMLMKAQEFARRKMLKNALNYYRVIKSQNIPPELKNMINRNITDITEFLEKFIMSKGG